MVEFTQETKDHIQLQLAIAFTKSVFKELAVSYEMRGDTFIIHFSFDQLVTRKILLVSDECNVNFNLRANGDCSIELSYYNFT